MIFHSGTIWKQRHLLPLYTGNLAVNVSYRSLDRSLEESRENHTPFAQSYAFHILTLTFRKYALLEPLCPAWIFVLSPPEQFRVSFHVSQH
jgi:hypothetical protein